MASRGRSKSRVSLPAIGSGPPTPVVPEKRALSSSPAKKYVHRPAPIALPGGRPRSRSPMARATPRADQFLVKRPKRGFKRQLTSASIASAALTSPTAVVPPLSASRLRPSTYVFTPPKRLEDFPDDVSDDGSDAGDAALGLTSTLATEGLSSARTFALTGGIESSRPVSRASEYDRSPFPLTAKYIERKARDRANTPPVDPDLLATPPPAASAQPGPVAAGAGGSSDVPEDDFVMTTGRPLDVWRLMMDLDTATCMESLKNEFQSRSDQVDIVQFCDIFRKHLSTYRHVDDARLLPPLCELFAEIDVNGDRTLEWEELTSYFIDVGASVFQTRQRGASQYVPSRTVDSHRHQIDRLSFLPVLDLYAACEGNRIGLYSQSSFNSIRKLELPDIKTNSTTRSRQTVFTNTKISAPISSTQGMASIVNSKSIFHDCIFVPSRNCIIASSSSLCMGIWNGSGDFSFNRAIMLEEHPQLCLAWHSYEETLYSGSINGLIHAWDIDEGRMKATLRGHRDMVMALQPLENDGYLASASLDSNVFVWDQSRGEVVSQLTGHRKGVSCLAFNPDYRCLISAGFDHHAMVWDPVVGRQVQKLRGHASSLVSVLCPQNTNEIITADEDGFIKVWDMRNFSLLQTFPAEEGITGLKSVTYCHNSCRISVAASRKVLLYDCVSTHSHVSLVERHPISAVIFNEVSMTILTAAKHSVKIWDAYTGQVRRSFNDLVRSDITAICLDDRRRKFIIGTHEGDIFVYNYLNGAFMKCCNSHASEVLALYYYPEKKYIISISTDRTVRVHDEYPRTNGILIKSTTAHDNPISCSAMSTSSTLIAVGSTDKSVRIIDLEISGELLINNHAGDMTCVAFLDPYPALVTADSTGGIYVWSFFPTFGMAVSISTASSQLAPASVLEAIFDPDLLHLFLGDEKGSIHVVDLEKVIRGAKLQPTTSQSYCRRLLSNFTRILPKHRRPMFDASTAPIIKSWIAHTDCITSMQYLPETKSLISSSYDCSVRTWSHDGTQTGMLNEAVPDRNWTFNIDEGERRRQNQQNVQEVLRALNTVNKVTKKFTRREKWVAPDSDAIVTLSPKEVRAKSRALLRKFTALNTAATTMEKLGKTRHMLSSGSLASVDSIKSYSVDVRSPATRE